MNNVLKLNSISFSNNGKRVNYDYSIGNKIKKFFNEDQPLYAEYGVDVSQVPKSILAIPFLSNVLTIAWYGCFDVEADELDEDFYNAMVLVKKEFEKRDASYTLTSKLLVNNLIKNTINGEKYALLFSGGVDAFSSYIREIDTVPDLVTIHGPDIAIKDTEQWNDLKTFIEGQSLLQKNNKNFIESNVRDFYTYEVNLLIEGLGWWGKVQHGLSLLGSVAPISFINGYKHLTISSTYSELMDVVWGSKPEIDEKITWAGIQIHHDAFDLRRQDKVDLIANFSKETNTPFRLRVCYSEVRDQFNCSNCEKCYRTILGLVLAGENPNNYGFNVDEKYYDEMFKTLEIGNSNKGMQYFWWELMEKAKTATNPYIFNDKEKELSQIKDIANGKIDKLLDEISLKTNSSNQKFKFILRNKFSKVYNLIKKIKTS
ncbi:hypothetical protein [Flavivirga jejuensis]|uniref:7-cyano-7-deazaguanine synthase n=1 Tax=Flavivirga jejuensis TaxID=870487 RepID=A0ABT8WRJ8_9FLAO|nr:hypothetical protein [Flavivirga jejuensis]MDO5975788.1 hypothetical protein [Flavivirga jejuensis]